jgi:cytochrome P450 PksS
MNGRGTPQIGGVMIPAGEGIIVGISSANRNESEFTRPDTLDIAREPIRHVGFGLGIHYCRGAFLARLEVQIAFDAILRHFLYLQLAVPHQSLRWRQACCSVAWSFFA